MRCLTPEEAVDLLGKSNVSVSMKEAWYRRELVLSLRHSVGQSRLGCGQPTTMPVFTFAHRLSLWLPGDGFRLVWVDHDEAGLFPNVSPLLHAARRGEGLCRRGENSDNRRDREGPGAGDRKFYPGAGGPDGGVGERGRVGFA